MMERKTRVMIVDDHEIIRMGLRKILGRFDDIEIVSEAENAEQLLQTIAATNVDVIILDIDLPGRSGLAVLSDLKTLNPVARILLLSMFPEDTYAVRALKAGASGYVSKKALTDELVTAIRRIAQGGTYVNAAVAEQLINEVRKPNYQEPHLGLSSREFEVLRLIASGKSVGTIAEQLSLSVHTVTTYRSRLMQKMDMKSNAELVRYALEKNIIR